MRQLRLQVDRIDLKMLQLLQQRTKLSGRIGETKRRHGADIYVPEREAELLARVKLLSKGKLPPRAVTAIYREVLSGSRAAQGQKPIGLLQASAEIVLLPGRWCFGACDDFLPKKTWKEVANGLAKGNLALALLTGKDLAHLLKTESSCIEFFKRFTVVGDFPSTLGSDVPLTRRIFVVTLRGKGASSEANRLLILIKCKSTVNAVKSLLHFMPDRSIRAEQLTLPAKPARDETVLKLARLSLASPLDGIRVTSQLLAARQSAGLSASILGIYLSPEVYGG